MRNTNKMQKKATNAIIRYLSINQSATRTELIEGALLTYGLSKSELENFSPKSVVRLQVAANCPYQQAVTFLDNAGNAGITSVNIELLDNNK